MRSRFAALRSASSSCTQRIFRAFEGSARDRLRDVKDSATPSSSLSLSSSNAVFFLLLGCLSPIHLATPCLKVHLSGVSFSSSSSVARAHPPVTMGDRLARDRHRSLSCWVARTASGLLTTIGSSRTATVLPRMSNTTGLPPSSILCRSALNRGVFSTTLALQSQSTPIEP